MLCGTGGSAGTAASGDVHYFIENGDLIIEGAAGRDKERAAERYFISGVRKHAEIAADLAKSFAKHGL